MIVPCKDCTERHPNCHSHCERYIDYDNENKSKREARALESIQRLPSPSLKSRLKKDTVERMRYGIR